MDLITYLRLVLSVLTIITIQLVTSDHSVRERIAKHKAWLEQRAARRQLHLHTLDNTTKSSNLGSLYYRHQDRDLTTPIETETNLQSIKSKFWKERNKLRKTENSSISSNSLIRRKTLDTSTIQTATATQTTGINGVTKTTEELNPSSSTPKQASISLTLPQTTDNNPQPISTTTEHSFPYNVANNKSFRPSYKSHGNSSTTRGQKLSNAMWGRWQKWTRCSRSCGGGVMSQSRHCLSRDTTLKNRTSIECIGLHKRYRICNEQSCPENDIDFREQQCIDYNNQTFHGKSYSWEAYVVDEAECELNCKPIGLNYYAMLNERVIDGTHCIRPIESIRLKYSGPAKCVEGVCKAIHSNGVLAGQFMNNGAVRCGSTVCKSVSELYTENPSRVGYHNIAVIPAGASNISILEMRNSDNYLALKRADNSFIINGDNMVSDAGVYNAAGAEFDYRRIDDAIESSDESTEGVTEWITATGPIKEEIRLMFLKQNRNPGIKYEYLLPVSIQSTVQMENDMPPSHTEADTKPNSVDTSTKNPAEKRKKKIAYIWRVVSFTSCSKTCGGGKLTPIIRCVREGTQKFYAHKRCAHLTKPSLNDEVLRCNVQPCPAYWKIDEWSACNCGLPNEREHQSREVECVQELSTGIVIHVNEGACLEKQSDKQQDCNCPKQTIDFYPNKRHHKHHHHQQQQQVQHEQLQSPPITLVGNSSLGKKVHAFDTKKGGVWLTSDWTEQCSTKCGDGVVHRSIFCDRGPKSPRCDIRYTPETMRQCNDVVKCSMGDWFIGPWSECFGDCFNLMRSRSVLCIKDNEIVADSLCESANKDNSTKPMTIDNCDVDAVSYCKPKWHYSEWTECTKSCGSGNQRRIAKCFEPDMKEKILKESDKCRYVERQQAFRSCNTHECEKETATQTTERVTTTTKKHVEPRVQFIQNDAITSCEDRHNNCHFAVRARLCTYDYYKENCCASCRTS